MSECEPTVYESVTGSDEKQKVNLNLSVMK